MDSRKSLAAGTKLKLITETNNTEIVKIEKCIGRGAGKLVYDAWVMDDVGVKKRRVIVKECFPIKYAVDRKRNQRIQWLDEKSREEALASFQKTKKRHESIQSIPSFMDSCSHVISELFSANDTQYVFLDKDNFITFREKMETGKEVSLFSVLTNVLALAQVIKTYHNENYLLLDIKPENFVVSKKNDSVVKLIDFDSIVDLTEIKEGVIQNLSYTENWAAPEVKAHKWSEIGIRSDIFSVGAVLYYGITGEYADVCARLNKYDISRSKLLGNINPEGRDDTQENADAKGSDGTKGSVSRRENAGLKGYADTKGSVNRKENADLKGSVNPKENAGLKGNDDTKDGVNPKENADLKGNDDTKESVNPKENANPKVSRELQRVLYKLLSASVTNRYPDMESVCVDLEKLIDRVNPKRRYLRSNLPKQSVHFIGRKAELRAITEGFQQADVVLISDIYGHGGMGKTELAKKFAVENAAAFDTIVFADCSKGIEFLVRQQRELTIENYEFNDKSPDCVSEFINTIKGLVDENTLLVLDDVTDFKEVYLQELLKCSCKYLITTRKRMEHIFSNWSVISLGSMEFEELQKIFYDFCSRTLAEEEEKLLPELFQAFYNITTYIPAISSLVNRGRGVAELLEEVAQDGCLLEKEGKVMLCRNNLPTEISVTELTEHLLRLGEYSEEVLAIFSRIALVGHNRIFRDELAEPQKQILVDEVIASGIVTYLPEYPVIGMNDVYGKFFREKYGVHVAGGEKAVRQLLRNGSARYRRDLSSLIFTGRWKTENLKCMLPYLDSQCLSCESCEPLCGPLCDPLFLPLQYKEVQEILYGRKYDRQTTLSIILENVTALAECIPFERKYEKEYDEIMADLFYHSMDYCAEAKEYEVNLSEEVIRNPISVLEGQLNSLEMWYGPGFDFAKDMPNTHKAVTEVCAQLLEKNPNESLLTTIREYAGCIHSDALESRCEELRQDNFAGSAAMDSDDFLKIPDDIDDELPFEEDDGLPSGAPWEEDDRLSFVAPWEADEQKWSVTLQKMTEELQCRCQYAHQFGEILYSWLKENTYSRTEICRCWSSIAYSNPTADAFKNILLLRACEEGVFGQATGKEQFTYKIGLIAEYFNLQQEKDVIEQQEACKELIRKELAEDAGFLSAGRIDLITDLAKWIAEKGNLELALKIAGMDYLEKKKLSSYGYAYKERILLIGRLANALNEKKIWSKALECLHKDFGEVILREEMFAEKEELSVRQKQACHSAVCYDVDKQMNLNKLKALQDRSSACTSVSFQFLDKIKLKFEYKVTKKGFPHIDNYDDLGFYE